MLCNVKGKCHKLSETLLTFLYRVRLRSYDPWFDCLLNVHNGDYIRRFKIVEKFSRFPTIITNTVFIASSIT